MTTRLSEEYVDRIRSLDIVQHTRERLSTDNPIESFVITLDEDIRDELQTLLQIQVPTTIPLRWIFTDSVPHVDTARDGRSFDKTYLVYLEGGGNLHIDEETIIQIEKGVAVSFERNRLHYTTETNGPRLILGPMNEYGVQVGYNGVLYFTPDLTSAVANDINSISILVSVDFINNHLNSTFGSLTIYNTSVPTPPGQIQTGWVVYGPYSYGNPYPDGTILGINELYNLTPSQGLAVYPLFGDAICFLENTLILTCSDDGTEEYRPIENIVSGDRVKTSHHGYQTVHQVGSRQMFNPDNDERSKNRLYRLKKDVYPELTRDLYLTGCHSILVDKLTPEQITKTKKELGKLYITDGKYRLMACIDDRSEPWAKEGVFNVYHIALDHEDPYMNYGIYANGLLVESTSKRMMKQLTASNIHQ